MHLRILAILSALLLTAVPAAADEAARLLALVEEAAATMEQEEARLRSKLLQTPWQTLTGKGPTALLPRSQSSVLTGSENVVSLQEWRTSTLSDGDPYVGARTAAEVSEVLDEDLSPAAKLVSISSARADLILNWATAVLLGDREEAYRLEIEYLLAPVYFVDYLSLSSFSLLDSDGPLWAGLLHAKASSIGLRLSSIPAKWDPEGYIRQRLRFAHDEVMRIADMIIATSAF